MQKYKQALNFQKKARGPDHATVGGTYYNMATLAKACGDAQQMRAFTGEALRVFSIAYGPTHALTQEVAEIWGETLLNNASW